MFLCHEILVGWEDETTSCITFSNDCVHHTCGNGATCIDGVRTYTCICPPGYTGKHIVFFGVISMSVQIMLSTLSSNCTYQSILL